MRLNGWFSWLYLFIVLGLGSMDVWMFGGLFIVSCFRGVFLFVSFGLLNGVWFVLF